MDKQLNVEQLADRLLSAYAEHRQRTGGTVGVRNVFVTMLQNEMKGETSRETYSSDTGPSSHR